MSSSDFTPSSSAPQRGRKRDAFTQNPIHPASALQAVPAPLDLQPSPQSPCPDRRILQVTDYLKKKGFTKTEAIFRQETSNLGPDGRPVHSDMDDGPKKFGKAFSLLREYVDNSLDLYKVCSPVIPGPLRGVPDTI